MTLPNGYHALAPGKIAALVTSLEMHAAVPPRKDVSARWTLRREMSPSPSWYKSLFGKLGGEFLWFSRLVMSDEKLSTIIQDKRVFVYALEVDGKDEGLLELDFREKGECEIAFFAVSRAVRGQGAGRFLMNHAIAWNEPIARLWVHTCSLDSPNALEFYQRSGFTPFKRQIEIADDPRVTGRLPRDAAPHIPIL